MELPSAYVTGLREVSRGVNSALPGAPVVAHIEQVRASRRLWAYLAGIFRRTGRARVVLRTR